MSCATSGAMAGTNWIAEAPVPMTATRLPARSTSWSHRAEWKAGPLNVSTPGTSGSAGSTRPPQPLTTTSAVRSPLLVDSRHSIASSSQVPDTTSVSQCRCGSTPNTCATCSR